MLNKQELTKLKAINNTLGNAKQNIKLSLPKSCSFDANRLFAVMNAEMRKCPKLLNCSVESLGSAMMLAARLGLEPDSQLGHFYMIPFNSKHHKEPVLQIIIGYKGMLELAMRSPAIKSIYAQEVYEDDLFEVQLGSDKHIRHIPNYSNGNKELFAVYAIAEYTSGAKEFEIMSKFDIEKIRERSKAKGSGPWVTDYPSMARKTVLRKMCKYLPMAIDAQRAATMDESSERGETIIDFDIIEGEIGEDVVEDKKETKGIEEKKKTDQTMASNLTDKLKDDLSKPPY